MALYSGNINGEKRLYVFDRTTGTGATQANFLTTIPISYPNLAGATTAYVTAGGKTHGTTAELYQYVGNRAYDNYRRTQIKSFTTNDPSEGITNTIIKVTPDPRIQLGIYASGGSQSGLTGNHMDEIHVTANSGITYQAFLGKITYNEDNSDIATDRALVDLIAYGVSGAADLSTLYTMGVGETLANKTNGGSSVIKVEQTNLYVDIDSHKQAILGQVGASLDSPNTFGTTIGDAGASQSIFTDVNNKELINFCSTLLPAFANGGSGMNDRTGRQETVFTLLAGTTGNLDNVDSALSGAIFGVTFNAVTGGSGTVSAFEEFCHTVLHKHMELLNNKGSVNKQVIDAKSIRDVDDIAF